MAANNQPLDKLVQRQFGLLTLQFLLGMAVNLIGLPDEVHGLAKASSGILLLLHVLLAVVLLVGAIQVVRLAAKNSPEQAKLARFAGAGVGTAILFGILTMSAPWGNLWSYLMAVAFIAAFGVYGRLYSKLKV